MGPSQPSPLRISGFLQPLCLPQWHHLMPKFPRSGNETSSASGGRPRHCPLLIISCDEQAALNSQSPPLTGSGKNLGYRAELGVPVGVKPEWDEERAHSTHRETSSFLQICFSRISDCICCPCCFISQFRHYRVIPKSTFLWILSKNILLAITNKHSKTNSLYSQVLPLGGKPWKQFQQNTAVWSCFVYQGFQG